MPNRLKFKVCGMTQAENMRQVAELRPDYLGLIFYPPSPRAVSPEQAAALPDFAGVERVGVFVNEPAREVLAIAQTARLTLVQLHGDESPAICAGLRRAAPQLQLIKAFALDDKFTGATLADYENWCDFFLFDTRSSKPGGSGTVFDWRILPGLPIKRPFFLGGGIGPANAAQAIAACQGLPLYALDLNSRAEIAPGVKSPAIVRQTMAACRLLAH